MITAETLLSTELINLFLKVGILFFEFIYLVYAYLVLRQVDLMNRSFATRFGFALSVISYGHFFAVIGLFLLSLLIL